MAKYSDIDLSFSRNPHTNDVSILTDDASVKASIRNLILTNLGERPFNSNIGSSVREMLFEPISPVSAIILQGILQTAIRNYEPRAIILGIKIVPRFDDQSYNITIAFRLVNDTRITLVPLTLERLR